MLWLINKSGTPVKYLNKVRKIMNFIILRATQKNPSTIKKKKIIR